MNDPNTRCLLMFDFDGVIADSIDVFVESLSDACRARGYPLVNNRDTFLRIFDGNRPAPFTSSHPI